MPDGRFERVLGVDFGSKRIGLATGLPEHGLATPRTPIEASGTLRVDAAAIARIARNEEAEAVILGIPENEEDDRMARVCRKLGEEIRSLGLPVIEVDESLTSVEATELMTAMGLKGAEQRKKRDSEAAARILERYFSQAK